MKELLFNPFRRWEKSLNRFFSDCEISDWKVSKTHNSTLGNSEIQIAKFEESDDVFILLTHTDEFQVKRLVNENKTPRDLINDNINLFQGQYGFKSNDNLVFAVQGYKTP